MRKLPLLLLVFLVGVQIQAQITNDSAIIKINPGATLYLEGDLKNLNQSIITNEGTLEVKGELNNELGSEFNSLLTAISIFHGMTVAPLINRQTDSPIKDQGSQQDQPKPSKRPAAKFKLE